MKPLQLLLTIIISVAAAFAVVHFMPNTAAPVAQESAYERVLRTGILRCGYADWPPNNFVKDPTTGQVSGLFVELGQAIADKLHVKIEWAENTGWGGFIESLKDRRIDAFCAGVWRYADRGKYLGFSDPVFYGSAYPYVRIDDHRFDTDLLSVNSPDIRIAAMDGEMSDVIAKAFFPKAVEVSIPQLGQISDNLVNIADHKADIVFTEPSFVDNYIKNNPGKLRRAQDKPFEIFSTSAFTVDIHEAELLAMLNSAQAELQNQGIIDRIIDKYNGDRSVFLRIAKPYIQP